MNVQPELTPVWKLSRVMNWSDTTAVATMVVVSLGGGGAIVLGLGNWIGGILANKYVEKLKQEIQQEVEIHKTRLRKSEFLFQKEFEATSAFISLRLRLLPRYTFSRDGMARCLRRFCGQLRTGREGVGFLHLHPRCAFAA